MKKLAVVLALVAAPAFADEVTDPAVIEQINTLLSGMQCEVDPSNIETDDGGYELDDVFCADGQYDIDLDAEMNVTEKRKE
ncbi:PepSY domain-containing protein [Cereibacter changlensis]|uniref:PepSY domain-containing protein n=2 Tax=Cereibacter changlensis TaxID=402884 RepID=A0A2T4JUA9_9RHOB|nr:PepSY domain-containing protein [Cereibacter changlensis]PTE21489.1 hypothetical protein C5F48_12060 [Cereibacter changlensis JA139]PZX52860.1 YpeB-like protein with putative protease inhibitory function [Cereibacter changlensis]TKA96952.1 PepSY domain-containing protein [Cereibacter changlensis]